MRRCFRMLLTAAALPLAACGSSDTPTQANATALLAVSPVGGAIGVDPSGVVTVGFNHAVMAGMEQYAALHEGDVSGAVIAGKWALSADRTTLTFTASAPLKSRTKYNIHLGGGMSDANGKPVNMNPGGMMGGQYATGSMMTGGGMMQGSPGMMGSGWQGAGGTYGMVFRFTTA